MSTFTDLRAAASPALRDWMDRHADHVAAVIADLPTAGARNVTDQHLADLHRGVEWDRRIDAEVMKLEALDNAELAQLVDREVIAVVNARSGVLPRIGTKREALERVFQQRTGHSLYASAEGMVEAARRLHPRAPARRTERDTLIAEIRTLGETGRTLVDAERFKWKVADLSGLLPTEQQLASTMRSLDDLREWRDELRAAMDAYTAKHKTAAPVVKAPRSGALRKKYEQIANETGWRITQWSDDGPVTFVQGDTKLEVTESNRQWWVQVGPRVYPSELPADYAGPFARFLPRAKNQPGHTSLRSALQTADAYMLSHPAT